MIPEQREGQMKDFVVLGFGDRGIQKPRFFIIF